MPESPPPEETRTPPPFTVEVATLPGAFERLADEWDALAAPSGTPTLSHAWLWTELNSYHADRPFRLITVRRGSELAAACALVRSRRACPRFWELIATDSPGSLVYVDTDALEALLRKLATFSEASVLSGLPRGGEAARRLERSVGLMNFSFIRKAQDVFTLPVRGTWEDFLSGLPSSRRKQLRRKHKQAEELGTVSFRALSPTAEEAKDLLQTFFEVEHSGWKKEQGASVLARPDERAFMEGYALIAAREGRLRLFFLDIDGTPAAGHLAIVFADRLWGLKIGYDEAFAKCSPGLLLDAEVLRHCFEAGLMSYEFMGKAEPWEAFWNPEHKSFVNVRIYRVGPRGLVTVTVDTVSRLLRRIGWSK